MNNIILSHNVTVSLHTTIQSYFSTRPRAKYGGGGSLVFLALPAFLPSMISSFLPKIREAAPLGPSFSPPLFFDQLPNDLIAQLVEHCIGIVEVMGSNPVQV